MKVHRRCQTAIAFTRKIVSYKFILLQRGATIDKGKELFH